MYVYLVYYCYSDLDAVFSNQNFALEYIQSKGENQEFYHVEPMEVDEKVIY